MVSHNNEQVGNMMIEHRRLYYDNEQQDIWFIFAILATSSAKCIYRLGSAISYSSCI